MNIILEALGNKNKDKLYSYTVFTRHWGNSVGQRGKYNYFHSLDCISKPVASLENLVLKCTLKKRLTCG